MCDSTDIADLDHIFSHCTIAKKYNQQLQTDIIPHLQPDIPDNLWWFTTSQNPPAPLKLKDWQHWWGDQGYLPSFLKHYLATETTLLAVAKLICTNRHQLWKEYWTSYLQTYLSDNPQLKNSPTHPPSTTPVTTAITKTQKTILHYFARPYNQPETTITQQ